MHKVMKHQLIYQHSQS